MSSRYNADREVAEKSDAEIEREIALKHAARSIACRKQYVNTGKAEWLIRAERWRDEALEHAAMVGDYGKFVAGMQKVLDDFQKFDQSTIKRLA